jgi:hypothetical protein
MTMPYFYIIKHKISGKQYAGSRWMSGCHPSELLQVDGYYTSSNTVHSLIDSDGLESFEIVDIVILDDPYTYETHFLKENNCAESDNWLNKHNNESKPPPYGSKHFKQLMIEKYGVKHNTHIPEVRRRMTDKQKEFYKNNPDKAAVRARKVADSKIKNGTTGKGIKRPNYSNNGLTGKWERSEDIIQKISFRQKQNSKFVKDNPMSDPEKRKLVSLSKLGKKKYVNPELNESRMFLPGTEPCGFILAKQAKINDNN